MKWYGILRVNRKHFIRFPWHSSDNHLNSYEDHCENKLSVTTWWTWLQLESRPWDLESTSLDPKSSEVELLNCSFFNMYPSFLNWLTKYVVYHWVFLEHISHPQVTHWSFFDVFSNNRYTFLHDLCKSKSASQRQRISRLKIRYTLWQKRVNLY